MKTDRQFITDKKAEMGIGTLIIFIAMVLVAAVAAGVLLDVASMVQQQAQKTGVKAIADVSNGFRIISILGDRNNTTGVIVPTIQFLELKVRLNAGSQRLSMNETLIEIDDERTEVTLSFRDVPVGWKLMSNATKFTAEPLRDPDGAWAAVRFMSGGTLVKIHINCTATGLHLPVQTHVSLKIIPKHGAATYETFVTPDAYGVARYVHLF